MKALKVLLSLIFAGALSACNTTSDISSHIAEMNSEYPSKVRFKREAEQRARMVQERATGETNVFTAFFSSSNSDYPSKQRFAEMGLTKDAMLMQEIAERTVGANHHIPELLQVAVTTTTDPRWVPIVGHKRQHSSYSEPKINNPRLVALRGPK